MLVKVPLVGDPKFYMMIHSQAVWAAIPDANGVLLHLTAPLNWPVNPEHVLAGAMGPTDLIIGLHKYAIADGQGEILPVRMPMVDVCKAFSLVPFSAATPDGPKPVGISINVVFAFSPAFDKEGALIGTNIYCTRPFAKVGNVKISVVERPEDVAKRLGLNQDDLLDPMMDATADGSPVMQAPDTQQ